MHIDLRKDITDMTWGHCHFLKLTCKIGDPISRDPKKRGGGSQKIFSHAEEGEPKGLKVVLRWVLEVYAMLKRGGRHTKENTH